MGNKKPTTALRNLKIKSVSVVDQGANQHAHIKLAKRAEEDPDTQQQTEEPVSNDAAFFARLGQAVAKLFRVNPKEAEDVEKEARTFANIDGARKTFERIYRISDALGDSLRSIASDDELTDDQKAAMIVETAEQVAAAIKTDIAGCFNGTQVSKGTEGETGTTGEGTQPPATEDPEANHAPEGTPAEATPPDNNIQKGESDMKFNTEAMTQEERAMLEDLQKRFGVEEAPTTTPAPAASAAPAAAPAAATEQNDGDIYKGLNPAVKAEIDALRKFREDAEEAQIMEVAKRYTIIGKKPEELAPVLKSLKAAGGTGYDDMIAMLDSMKATMENSGVFGEIGKRGNTGSTGEEAWGQIETAATELMKSNANMTRAQAIEKACDAHPELLEAYENSRK